MKEKENENFMGQQRNVGNNKQQLLRDPGSTTPAWVGARRTDSRKIVVLNLALGLWKNRSSSS
jgi:hypothetical protein